MRRLHLRSRLSRPLRRHCSPGREPHQRAVRETNVAIRKETLILRHSREIDCRRFGAIAVHRAEVPVSSADVELRRCARILRRNACVPSPRIQSMATASKSSGKKARRKTTAASKRSSTRAKSGAKTATGPKRKSSSTRKPAAKRTGTRAAKKQSPVTRIKRVATTVLHQGATAAKQGVQAVAGLVENVKDRVTT